MYRKLLASTALALVVSGGAFAQDAAPADPAMAPADPAMETPAAAPAEAPAEELVTAEEKGIAADGWLATEIIGETIYNSTADDAESIGEVNDFVLGPDGEIGAVVVGVGGFLGIGEKNVAIDWNDLELAKDMEGNNRLVAAMTREQLETAAEFNREEWLASEAQAAAERAAAESATGGAMAPAAPMAPADDTMAPAAPAPADDAMAPADDAAAAPADDAMATEEGPADDAMAPAGDAMAPADDAAAAPVDDAMATEEAPADDAMATEEAPADDAAAADASADAAATTEAAPAAAVPAFDGLEQVATADISAEDLTGTAVYGAGDEEIGSIGDIILSEDGAVQAVIIDFGGFLGIGTKPVAVSFENLSFLRDESGGLLLRTPLTAEQLEAAPEYNAEAYTAAPGENSLIVE